MLNRKPDDRRGHNARATAQVQMLAIPSRRPRGLGRGGLHAEEQIRVTQPARAAAMGAAGVLSPTVEMTISLPRPILGFGLVLLLSVPPYPGARAGASGHDAAARRFSSADELRAKGRLVRLENHASTECDCCKLKV